ncbi:MAG: UDP-3-O-(3-hydroxymyristoyl)glucosamine N-acyltransferase [Deltaproteobacteria bacterium]|nr:UDP-3-O-(3-hydroxymyristoyl)glucosamine N-acyltransferase [Deltaproteobacteria bacterium]
MKKTVEQLVEITGGRLIGDGNVVIRDVASLEEAGPGEITFILDKAKLKLLPSIKAGAIIVPEGDYQPGAGNLIATRNPQIAFAKAMDVFRPALLPGPGIHPKAEVSARASVGEGVSIQAYAVVEKGATIGPRTVVYPGVYIGQDARIGADCIIYSGVAIREGCIIGDRVIVHCNTVIGSDGFGYAWDNDLNGYRKLPQRGIVRIDDDCELGACVTVDRAAIGETVIGSGSKIDNLVQVAHNVKIGEHAIIVAQVGIAGSVRVGDRVQIGGQVGIVGHIDIGDGAMIGAQSGISGPVPSKAIYSGTPAIPHHDWLKASVIFAKLPELKKKINELEKRLAEIEGKKG